MKFVDPYENLRDVVDIGGDKYFLGEQKPVNLGFYSRKDFINAYGSESEYLIRKYLYFGADPKKTQFDSDSEKDQLIRILKIRIKNLQASPDFSSNTLYKTITKRNVININKLIDIFQGSDYIPGEGFKFPEMPWGKDKKYVENLTEEQVVNLILEMSWYLLHPLDVPKKIQSKWYSLVRKLDTMRIINIVEQLKEEAGVRGLTPEEKPLNYFKRINVGKVAHSDTIQNAFDEAKRMALDAQEENTKMKLEKRLESVLSLLQMRKYLDGSGVGILRDVNSQSNEILSDISGALISNPMVGGALKETLGDVMGPFFEYYKELYDPIYSFIQSSLKNTDEFAVQDIMYLMHIAESLPISSKKYGVYRILDTTPSMKKIIKTIITSTKSALDSMTSDDVRDDFLEQIQTLPTVRLTKIEEDSIPFVRFVCIGDALKIPTKDDFIDPSTGFAKKTSDSHSLSSSNTSVSSLEFNSVYSDVVQFFGDDIYIVYMPDNSEDDIEKIPMRLYDIHIQDIDIKNKNIPVSVSENNINKIIIKEEPLYLDDLLDVNMDYSVNASELALVSIIGFRNRMP